MFMLGHDTLEKSHVPHLVNKDFFISARLHNKKDYKNIFKNTKVGL